MNFLGEPTLQKELHNKLGKIKTSFANSDCATQKHIAAVPVLHESSQVLEPQEGWKVNSIYKLLKAEPPTNKTSEFKETFDAVNKALGVACELALKQPLPGKQHVPMNW